MGARRLPRTTQEPWTRVQQPLRCSCPETSFRWTTHGCPWRGWSWELHGCPGTSYEHARTWDPMGCHWQCSGCWQAVTGHLLLHRWHQQVCHDVVSRA